MKKGGGVAKGSKNERAMCKMLSLWWTDGKEEDVFCRTNEGSSSLEEIGDMKARKAIGFPLTDAFCFEFKHYKDVNLFDLLDDSMEKTFLKWWNQVNDNAFTAKKRPFLLFKRNRRGPYIAMRREDVILLENEVGWFPFEDIIDWSSVEIMHWKKFVRKVSPDDIKITFKK
jgi:hypothetical protein